MKNQNVVEIHGPCTSLRESVLKGIFVVIPLFARLGTNLPTPKLPLCYRYKYFVCCKLPSSNNFFQQHEFGAIVFRRDYDA